LNILNILKGVRNLKYYYFKDPFNKDSIYEVELDNLEDISMVLMELYSKNKYNLPLKLVELAIFDFNSGEYKFYDWLANHYMFKKEYQIAINLLVKLKEKMKPHIHTKKSKMYGDDEKYEFLLDEIDFFCRKQELILQVPAIIKENPNLNMSATIDKIGSLLKLKSGRARQIYDKALRHGYIKRELIHNNRYRNYVADE
jgi:hypothetical protein